MATIPIEFARQYDIERAGSLRRRAVAYCLAVLAIVGVSWTTTVIEWINPLAFEDGDPVTSADILTDVLFTLLYGGALLYFLRRARDRAEIVRAFQWVVAVAGVVAVAVTPLVMNTAIIPDATLEHTPESDRAQAVAILMTIFILHILASVFVALSPREGLIPLVPIFATYAAWVLLVAEGDAPQRTSLIAAFPLSGLPGFAWSWMRYRSFAQRFQSRAFQRRYAEINKELACARRVHESLFPRPIECGDVRLAYHYEPAQHVGGDFLFVHKDDDALNVVLLDVTGHGVAAALAVARFNAELERAFSRPRAAPADILLALNAFVARSLAPQGMYATALCMRLETDVVHWASAGHPPALLRADGDVHPLDATTTMLGVLDDELFDPASTSRPIRDGDVVIAYTDGVIEASGLHAPALGVAGLRGLVEIAAGPVVEHIRSAVESLRNGPPADDTLIVEIVCCRSHAAG